jgi:hypothetical protein
MDGRRHPARPALSGHLMGASGRAIFELIFIGFGVWLVWRAVRYWFPKGKK